ncbi:MAG: hypothetical protein IJ377_04410 [Rikenellaceae bacterium]|nr:hypothetical protein [Rikenellaceae bacterium]
MTKSKILPINFELRFGDFYEIDTRGGARDFQSRRPTPPRAYFENKQKTVKPAHMAKTPQGTGMQGGCWFCKLNMIC